MSPQAEGALIAGLFALLNLALTFWVKHHLETKIEAEKQRLIARANADVSRETGLYDFLEQYFVKLNEALKAITDLCSERTLALDNKAFMPQYSDALGNGVNSQRIRTQKKLSL